MNGHCIGKEQRILGSGSLSFSLFSCLGSKWEDRNMLLFVVDHGWPRVVRELNNQTVRMRRQRAVPLWLLIDYVPKKYDNENKENYKFAPCLTLHSQ